MHFGRQTVWQAREHRDLLTDYARRTADLVAKTTGIDDVHKAWERAHRMYQSLGPLLATHDVFVCPTLNLPAVAADHDPFDPDFRVAGVRVDGESGWLMTHHFNMLHNCPVMSVPSGKASTGVPTGIQIVARSYDDQRVFAVAAAFEAAVGGWYREAAGRPVL
jgi:amidase